MLMSKDQDFFSVDQPKTFYTYSLPLPKRSGATAGSCEEDALAQLASLGFVAEDCNRALRSCDGCVEDAAIWLTQNADPVRRKQSISSIEV